MNWHKFIWPIVLTAMIIAFISGYWIVAAGIFVVVGTGAIGLELYSRRQ